VASQNGHLAVVQAMLVSERDIATKTRSTFNNKTAAEQGRGMPTAVRLAGDAKEEHGRKMANGPKCADLIDAYEKEPVVVRNRLRNLPVIRDTYIGWMFALLVFFSDGFLQLPKVQSSDESIVRFFTISSRLPLDLQMLVCNRMFGSAKDVILSRDSEAGFRWVARA
jgi:hypothetical protein